MPSSFIKVLLTFTSISPALLLLYIYRVYHEVKHLSIYVKVGSLREIEMGVENFLSIHFLLLLFLALVVAAQKIMKVAEAEFPRGRIAVGSIKSADSKFGSVITSLLFVLLKLISPDLPDWIILICFVLLGLALATISTTSFHYNVVLRVFFGYRHYEIATQGGVTYLMLSRTELINPIDISEYVQLADHMMVNIS